MLADFACFRYWWIVFALGAIGAVLRIRRVVASTSGAGQSLAFINQVATELVIICTLPWFAMAVGSILGGLPLVAFLRPQDFDTYVVLFYLVVLMSHILGGYWMFFRAREFFMVGYKATSLWGLIKVYVALVIAGAGALYVMVQSNIHVACP